MIEIVRAHIVYLPTTIIISMNDLQVEDKTNDKVGTSLLKE